MNNTVNTSDNGPAIETVTDIAKAHFARNPGKHLFLTTPTHTYEVWEDGRFMQLAKSAEGRLK